MDAVRVLTARSPLMPHLVLRLLPLLSLLGFFAGSGWLDDRRPRSDDGLAVSIAANGMAIDPDGGNGTPVIIPEPTDPDL
jgi:hypothetical protein